MLEESLICQRVVCEGLPTCGKDIYEIEIDQEWMKSCLWSYIYQKYKEVMKSRWSQGKRQRYET